ncbi:hypothetical protein [Kocuria rhizosphaericola]|uniref:hypothetical protein n=1 Tax=Kocuria rhizosphaericola TaxID=3376284 RepID=UPI0037B64E65
MAADKTNWNLTGGQLLQLLACSMVYPVFQAFRAGLTLYGVLLLAVVIPSFVVGRRLYKRGQAQEPGNIIRTYDHREKRPPDTGTAQPGNSD